MKKIYFTTLVLGVVLSLGACSKDKEEENIGGDCLAISTKITDALTAYSNDPSVQNCKNYFNALKEYVNSNSCFGGIFFEAYKQTFNELEADNCN